MLCPMLNCPFARRACPRIYSLNRHIYFTHFSSFGIPFFSPNSLSITDLICPNKQTISSLVSIFAWNKYSNSLSHHRFSIIFFLLCAFPGLLRYSQGFGDSLNKNATHIAIAKKLTQVAQITRPFDQTLVTLTLALSERTVTFAVSHG